MSSDYIPRLRAELLRAGARGRTRRRVSVALRPVVAVGAIAALVAALLIFLPGPASDERPADSGTTVRLGYLVSPAEADHAAVILRERLEAAGIRPAQVIPAGGRIDVVVPATARDALPALVQPGRLAIYDWEASVIGGTDPVSSSAAHARAASASVGLAVRTETDSEKWFALAGRPPIGNADVAGAHVATDPTTGDPVVIVSLTAEGRRTFGVITRKLAQRGADQALGGDPLETSQHLAIAVDDRIAALPYVNWRVNPDGIDGAAGVQLPAPESARLLAAMLSAGPLPELTPDP
ncbi:SecDF P1 head subdomain-containing protein [Solirubrobacter soli]|uniref:SecDF P1 head subdomain-containing protein n=1 Tax=Solirubrobacter soli TaxID=363832 RepID=UPI00042A6487|nr:hypothetical protein [Solirubrobacter soli]